jgi:hypothetical protein
MIQIDVIMSPIKTHSEDALNLQINWVNEHFHDVFSFFESCVDQDLVLNFIDKAQDGETDVTVYYSVSLENARTFEQKFQDLSSEFSMRKMWNEIGFETSISMKEIEFDPTGYSRKLGSLVDNELKTIWGIDFPASYA